MSVEDKVKKIIAEKLGVDLEEVVPDATFVVQILLTWLS